MNRDLTTGSLGKQIVIFSLPYFLSYFLQMLYGLADMYITGQYNGAAVITAVSVGSQIMHLVTVVLVGVTMGTTVMIGRHIGGGNREEASKVAGNTFVFFILLSLVLTAVMLILMDPIIKALSVPAESVVETRAYLKICVIGIPAITMYNVISAIFRGTGDSRTPMYFIFIACVINIILDYVFIGPMGMRAAGAAYGTVLAQLISVICSLFVLLKKDIGLKLERPYFKPDKKTLKSMLSVGLPVAFQDGLIQVSFLIITTIANRRGVEIAAAVGIVEKIITFLFLVPSTLESTVSTVSSHNIGAGKFDRAKKTLFIGGAAAVIYGFTVFVICQFISGWLVSMFTKDSVVITYGIQYLRPYSIDCMLAGVHFCFSGFFIANDQSMISFIHNIISIIVIRIPGASLASKYFPDNLTPMGMAAPIGSTLSIIICVAAYVYFSKKGRFGEIKRPSEAEIELFDSDLQY